MQIRNKIVLFAFLFIFVHMIITLLNLIQGSENPSFKAAFTSVTAILSYITIAILPFIKVFFMPLRMIPFSQIWLDHLIVSIPTIITQIITRMIN